MRIKKIYFYQEVNKQHFPSIISVKYFIKAIEAVFLCLHIISSKHSGSWRNSRQFCITAENSSNSPRVYLGYVNISKRGYVQSLCYENQFSFLLKLELIIITRISHLESL